jgi:Na+-driven multidrug efflux pump
MDLKIVGIAIAGIVTNSLTFIIIKCFMLTQTDLSDTRISFFDKSTLDARGLMTYVKIGLPQIAFSFFDYWIWE